MTATRDHPDLPGPDAMTTRLDGGSGRPETPRGVARSRMGGVWVTLIVAAFVLLLLLVFILQNGQQAQVSFLGAHGELPMGVALLLAAIFGVLLVALPGTARILQLRALGRRSSGATSVAGPSATGSRTPEGQ
ncbi:MAG TPA: lipopolysaccharide assembly protein LapA domain-containing protein [Micromonosporaceae bacterium]|nr:lipopolysaccharide assembly protein LapA domain-containing protein [Micromonosporaceae bacterium]